jgi:hypothetical protein
MSDVTLLTYDELARAFGTSRESARQLVIRKRWGRRKGNDGKIRIEVPTEALPVSATSERTSHRTSDDTSHAPGTNPSDGTGQSASDVSTVVDVLLRHLERIEHELKDVAAERDGLRERAADRDVLAAQLEGLRAMLGVERRRGDEAVARVADLAVRADRAEHDRNRAIEALAALLALPWWRRLLG